MDDEARVRAEARRKQWVGGVARSFAEMEEVSAAWWARMTPEERLGCVFDMYDELMLLKDPAHEPASRLQRAVGGVRPRRG
jgi:hypothetical protein